MYQYYFKIKKNDVEFEFSTDDLKVFDEKAKFWIEKIFCAQEENYDKDQVLKEQITNKKQKKDNTNFEQILQDAISNPKTEIKEKNDKENYSNFKTFFDTVKPESQVENLLAVVFFLKKQKHISDFSLKQINHELFPVTQTLIDQNVIAKALEEGYIETNETAGQKGLKTYSLSASGSLYFEKKFIE